MLIVSSGDSLHEIPKSIFWKELKNYFKMLSAEIFTQSAKH